MKFLATLNVVLVGLLTLFLASCTEDKDDQELFDLDSVVPSPVVVTLDGDLGTISEFTGAEGMPSEDEVALLGLLGGIIKLSVTSEDGVTVSLIDGQSVSGTPEGAGEYQIVKAADGTLHSIVFFNETNTGRTLKIGDEYDAVVDVSAENDFFVTGAFTREVTVQGM